MVCLPLLTDKDVFLLTREKLYKVHVQSRMLHGSETWSMKKENDTSVN